MSADAVYTPADWEYAEVCGLDADPERAYLLAAAALVAAVRGRRVEFYRLNPPRRACQPGLWSCDARAWYHATEPAAAPLPLPAQVIAAKGIRFHVIPGGDGSEP